MTVGSIAALIAATAVVVLVALLAVPLLKLGGVLDELRSSVRDIDRSTLEILTELRGTVRATNEEIGRLGDVTANVHSMSEHAARATEHASEMTRTVAQVVQAPVRAARAVKRTVTTTVGSQRRRRQARHRAVAGELGTQRHGED